MQGSRRRALDTLLRLGGQEGPRGSLLSPGAFTSAAAGAAGSAPPTAAAAAAATARLQPGSAWRQLRQAATAAHGDAAGAAQQLAADMGRAVRLSVPVGIAAGVVGSTAGSGGAAVIVPLLSKACATIPQRVLAGTSLAAVLATACTSTASFLAGGCVDVPSALLIAPPAMLLAPVGARFTSRVDCNALKRLLGFFLLAAAPLIPLKFYLFSARAADAADAAAAAGAAEQQPATAAVAAATPPDHSSSSSDDAAGWRAAWERLRQGMPGPATAAMLAAAGGLAGFTSGLLGVGGGTVATPLVALVTPFSQATVLGTTLLAMVPTTAVGLLQHHRLGNVSWRLAAGLSLGSVLGGAAGSQAAVHAPPGTLEAVFTVTLLLLARTTLRGVK